MLEKVNVIRDSLNRFDLVTKTMVLGFEILLDCNNKVPELKKKDTTWFLADWTNYMDPNAMTTLLGDPICNIEEEEYWEVCQHTTTAVIVDMMMMTVSPIVTTIAEVMIARTMVMIGVNPLVIEKMKMQTYSLRNMIVMWTIMMKT